MSILDCKNGEIFSSTARECVCCGVTFIPTRPWMKFCNKKCRLSFWLKTNPRVKINDPNN